MVYRYRLDLAYNGRPFSGWQSQSDGSGVQDQVENALLRLVGEPVRLLGASRTDAGVHCLHQVTSFAVSRPLDLETLRRGLQALLPASIVSQHLFAVDQDFNPHRPVKAKLYRYHIWNSSFSHPFAAAWVWHIPYQLDLQRLLQEAISLKGRHDFRTFCATGSSVKHFQREIFDVQVRSDGPLLTIDILGDGFLKHMIRIICGTLVDIARGYLAHRSIAELIAGQNRILAGITAAPQGLTLMAMFLESNPVSVERALEELRHRDVKLVYPGFAL